MILVVEDNEVLLHITLLQLGNLGLLARGVISGLLALEELKSQHFNLVLMDCSMPGMDGFEITRQIRQLGGPRIPIIAMTARAQQSDLEECLASGMDDYLSKPFLLDELKQKLKRWIDV